MKIKMVLIITITQTHTRTQTRTYTVPIQIPCHTKDLGNKLACNNAAQRLQASVWPQPNQVLSEPC